MFFRPIAYTEVKHINYRIGRIFVVADILNAKHKFPELQYLLL
jgi:hypothetical protein